MESIDNLQPVNNPYQPPRKKWLPNAIAAIFIGGHSILAAIHPVTAIGGIICGVLALRKYKTDKPLYDSDPVGYARSYKYLKAGRTTGIVGISVASAVLGITLTVIVAAAISDANRRSRYDDYYDPYDDYYEEEYYDPYDY